MAAIVNVAAKPGALSRALARAKDGQRFVLADGVHELRNPPEMALHIQGASGARPTIVVPERLTVDSDLVLQNASLILSDGPIEMRGSWLRLLDVEVRATSSAVLLHSGATGTIRSATLVTTGGPVDVAFVEVRDDRSRLSMDGCKVAGHLGLFAHQGAEASLRETELRVVAGPAVRVHGATADLTRVVIEGAPEAGVYARDRAEVSLRGCTMRGSTFAQIEARDSFVRVVGGTIEGGEDDGVNAHEGARVELESVLIRDNDIGVRAMASEVRMCLVDVVGRAAAVVADGKSTVELTGGELVADEAACLEAFDGGVIRAQGTICRNRDGDTVSAYDGGRVEELPAAAVSPLLDDDACWRLIADATIDARALGARDVDDVMPKRLVARLSETSIATIVSFHGFFWRRMSEAYRRDLWGVAYVMNGGCSDDGFDYFCGWLIGQGRERFSAALMYPELAAAGFGPDECFANEDMLGVAVDAYKRLTGSKSVQDFHEVHATRVRRELVGDDWDEDTIVNRYPSLARFR